MARSAHKPIPYLRTYRRMHTAYSQKDVALLLGLKTASMVTRWERGERVPTLENGLRLSQIYRTPVEALFADLVAPLKEELARRDAQLRLRHAQPKAKPALPVHTPL
jgi:transcriptional regulator with XRE-family HTH domain